MSDKIRIDTVHGGRPEDRQTLKRNYFLATGVNDTYQFFDPGDDLITTEPAVVARDVVFQFQLKEMPDVTWTVSKFEITPDHARGDWTNTLKIDEDEGTFTAQAGGGAGEETVSSANA